MSFLNEFKTFALKGNVIDLAVGVIIGGAFGKIVDSVVGDLIMPLVSRAFGGLDFSNYYWALAGQTAGLPLAEAKKLGAVFAYGNFITVALNFTILAVIIFLMIRQMNRMSNAKAPHEAPAAAPITPEDVLLLREIRDSLRNKG
jgi:large conductance mechanosensitive channel